MRWPIKILSLLLVSILFYSCHNYGRFVKAFHIRGQHYVPTYAVNLPADTLKFRIQQLYKRCPALSPGLENAPSNDYREGNYYAQISDSLSKNPFMLRIVVYNYGLKTDSAFSKIKFFAVKYPDKDKWQSFYAVKTSRRQLKQIDLLMRKYFFSKIPKTEFVMIDDSQNIFGKKKQKKS